MCNTRACAQRNRLSFFSQCQIWINFIIWFPFYWGAIVWLICEHMYTAETHSLPKSSTNSLWFAPIESLLLFSNTQQRKRRRLPIFYHKTPTFTWGISKYSKYGSVSLLPTLLELCKMLYNNRSSSFGNYLSNKNLRRQTTREIYFFLL